jgi:hypothetical protein
VAFSNARGGAVAALTDYVVAAAKGPSRRSRLLLLILVLALFLGTFVPTSAERSTAVDLSVTGVEVTQATQTTTNSIKLVALRSTAVRATLGVAGSASAVASVTGRLHVFVNGAEITPAAGVAPINAPFTAPLSPQRANENDTLNFELVAPVSGLTATADADFRVDVTPVAGETNTGNNSGAANNLTVIAGTDPSLFFTRINYTPSGLGLPSNAFIQSGVGDAFVRGILPVNDGDPNLYRQGLFPSLTYSEDADGDGRLNALGADGNDLISLLASCRQLIVNAGLGANSTTFLFGWLAGNPIDGNGLGQTPGNNAFGNTDPIRGQRSYAHELTHNFGFNHITTTINQVGWDVGARLPNNPAGNNTSGRVKPTTLFDVQVAGQLTNQAWVDTSKYTTLETNTALGFSGGGSPDVRKKSRKLVAVIQGIFDRSGKKLLLLKPVFRYPWLSQPTPSQREGQYVAVVRTSVGTQKVAFQPRLQDDPEREVGAFGFFEVMVPAQGVISDVRISDLAGRQTFGRLVRSKLPPRITIVSPRRKAKLSAKTRVVWKVSDSDTSVQRLMYQVAYSPDGGRTFVPVGVDLKARQLVFDSRQIQKSAGRGLIRVFVSDGLNTAFADVGGLSTTAARFR